MTRREEVQGAIANALELAAQTERWLAERRLARLEKAKSAGGERTWTSRTTATVGNDPEPVEGEFTDEELRRASAIVGFPVTVEMAKAAASMFNPAPEMAGAAAVARFCAARGIEISEPAISDDLKKALRIGVEDAAPGDVQRARLNAMLGEGVRQRAAALGARLREDAARAAEHAAHVGDTEAAALAKAASGASPVDAARAIPCVRLGLPTTPEPWTDTRPELRERLARARANGDAGAASMLTWELAKAEARAVIARGPTVISPGGIIPPPAAA